MVPMPCFASLRAATVRWTASALTLGVLLATFVSAVAIPVVGERAPDFSLTALDGSRVVLSAEVARGPVVLVVLRGFPTYQCPFCTRQFGDYLAHGRELDATGARVLFVYPGPPDGLEEHARALVAERALLPSYRLLLDPNYAFTERYGLRWNAPRETAYPSTFVIDRTGFVRFAHTSREHGDRVPVAQVLKVIAALGAGTARGTGSR
jgi:peroxiredoxin